jgi:tetraether lipid synthase
MPETQSKLLSRTESLCPECLQLIPASIVGRADQVFLEKTCPRHGSWQTPIWRGSPGYETWQRPKTPAHPELCYTEVKDGCPYDCGLCADHRQNPCSVLLEVTQQCPLGCPICFADSAVSIELADPDLGQISDWYDRIMAAAGPCNIQLSGGEPTVRNDLPEIIALGRRKGFSFIQLNSNGLRLAEETGYAERLAEAGLTTVFLQFDGLDDHIHVQLRGRPLMQQKRTAIERCGAAGLGVVLVPTLVPGVNSDAIGAIIRFAIDRLPLVRGIHFQPISYFGRFEKNTDDRERLTLPQVMQGIEAQTDGLIKASDFIPPGTENARCSFHCSFMVLPNGHLRRISSSAGTCCSSQDGREGLLRTIDSMARQWSATPGGPSAPGQPMMDDATLDLDTFLERATHNSLSISCMAFQDARNLDLERLRDCCISVMSPAGQMIPFCAYNLTSDSGKTLYRNRQEPRP